MQCRYRSILFERVETQPPATQPPFFGDLHLDQIASALVADREQFALEEFFHQALHDVHSVRYRQLVAADLEREDVLGAVREFCHGLARMRECLARAKKLHYARQRQRWFLDAVRVYCETVVAFDQQLAELELRSDGMRGWREYLSGYVDSAQFESLAAQTGLLVDELDAIRYAVHIRGNRVRVSAFDGEPDLSEQIEQTFARFRRTSVSDHRARLRDYVEMNHVEAQTLDLVVRLNPETFGRLDAHCAQRAGYLDDTVGRFDREVQFYLAYLDYIAPLKEHGLAFCYPRVSARSKDVCINESFDLALAKKLVSERKPVVCNDFRLDSPERILVVSGPNNGGKTTFARAFGQLHYLASLGLPVPGADAKLFLPDRIFTHFEREEDIQTLRGKFEDELFRIRQIFEHATARSLLVMNESFGSTTLRDALVVGAEVMRQIIDLDALCVFVTFVDELASLSESTVSMMSTVVPDDPAVRTFKVLRKPADGLAYAAAIAEKYGLSYDSLTRRIAR